MPTPQDHLDARDSLIGNLISAYLTTLAEKKALEREVAEQEPKEAE